METESKLANDGPLTKKYKIEHLNGTPIDKDALYFVLRIDGNCTKSHYQASRKALLTYAEEIKTVLPDLAKDIKEKIATLENIDKISEKVTLLQKALITEREKIKL